MTKKPKILILAAIILVTATAVAMQQADAHVAVDEVARYGGAGFDPAQEDHQHPHNRTVWYYPENSTYAGSPVDVYEQTLIGDYVAPEPEPEPIPTEENFVDDQFIVMFEIREAEIDCADGTNAENASIYQQNHDLGVIYSSGPDQLTTLGYIYSSGADANTAVIFIVVEGQIDKDRGIAKVSGIADQSSNYYMCPDANEFFAFDIEINCDGSGLEFTSRNDNGYSISATDEQTHAVCYY